MLSRDGPVELRVLRPRTGDIAQIPLPLRGVADTCATDEGRYRDAIQALAFDSGPVAECRVDCGRRDLPNRILNHQAL